MRGPARRKAIAAAAAAAALAATAACWPGGERREAPQEPRRANVASGQTAGGPAADALALIDHLRPSRDSVGPTPSRFEWTPVAGADRYAVGLWNEIDQLVWRADDVATTAITLPEGYVLDPGTYFWSVVALHDGRPVGESGRSAFVVQDRAPR